MRLAVLPGDDIGPEITEAALAVLNTVDRAFSLGLKYDVHEVGMQAHKRWGSTLPDAALRAVREADGIVLGPAGMTAYPPGIGRRYQHPGNDQKAPRPLCQYSSSTHEARRARRPPRPRSHNRQREHRRLLCGQHGYCLGLFFVVRPSDPPRSRRAK